MKFSQSWLREFVDPGLTTDALVEQLTMAGLEVDGYEPVAAEFSKVVVGEILTTRKHPDADKLVVCEVSDGAEVKQVVCGAPNARVGIKVPFALVGARLEDFKIKKAKLRGVESFGMLCSERELGLSDNHEGLMEFPADAPVGQTVREYLDLDDVIIDLDLTPNRSDCLGMVGLARETGLINRSDVRTPEIEAVPATTDETFPVVLKDPAACPRFVGRVIRGIDIKAPTPLWMIEKLRRSDVRSIDPVVDVTNYIMLELGQPMHAYDLSRLSGQIIVRKSLAGETVTLLDGSEITLQPDTLLITDESGPIGMAGIMGGLSTAVSDTTVDIYLESAFFSPPALAGRARAHALNTDASHRFERGVDWQGQARAVERATALLCEIAGGEPGPTTETVASEGLPETPEVHLRLKRVKQLLGVDVAAEEVSDMLSRLEFEHEVQGEADETTWRVLAPPHRFDIAIEEDLVEEISRIYGYNNLPVRTPRTHLTMAPVAEASVSLDDLKDNLVARGYQEAITYSFVDGKSQSIIDPANEPISLANPLSNELAVMRTSLWPGLIKALVHNLNRQQHRVRLFETGLRFLQPPNQDELAMADIRQEAMVAGVVCGSRHGENWSNSDAPADFFDVKGDVESLLQLTGAPAEFVFTTGHHPALHPGQTAVLMRSETQVGYLGMLDPRAQQALDIDHPVFLFEFEVAHLLPGRLPEASGLSKFPEVRRDIAVIVDNSVSATAINACVESAVDETFKNLKLFDVYQGKGIDPTRKSIALGLTFQHASRTLTDEEINGFVDRIVDALSRELEASLRN